MDRRWEESIALSRRLKDWLKVLSPRCSRYLRALAYLHYLRSPKHFGVIMNYSLSLSCTFCTWYDTYVPVDDVRESIENREPALHILQSCVIYDAQNLL